MNTVGKHVAPQTAVSSTKENLAVLAYLRNGYQSDVLNGTGKHRA